jgi:TPR repeat protein
MRMFRSRLVPAVLALALFLGPGFVVPAGAGPLDDGIAAFQRGDFGAARAIFEPLAQNGDPVAQYYLGDLIVRFATDKNKPEGLIWLRQSAEAGVPDAMNQLAAILAEGRIVSQDQRKANELFMQAASLGYLPAYNNLGLRSYRGVGRPPDPVDASEWFRLAADQGFAEAQFNLAVMYAGGEGVKFDLVEAYMWMSLAMKQGHPQATQQRPAVLKAMTPPQIQEGEKRLRAWKPVQPKRPAS